MGVAMVGVRLTLKKSLIIIKMHGTYVKIMTFMS
jgi:hypothetical protein